MNAWVSWLTILIWMNAFHIRDWETDRENADTRKYQQLVWYRNPVKLLGEGIGHTLAQPERQGPFLYGMFKIIEQVAASGKKNERGWLVRNGTVLTAERMANLTRLPVAYFEEALKFFSTDPMDWLEIIDFPSPNQDATGRTPGDSPGNLPSTGRTPGVLRHPTDRPTDVQRPLNNKVQEEPEQPDDRMVFDHVEAWLGEMASGTPSIDRSFAEKWIADMAGRTRGWPRDWKRKLEADWRVAWRTWGANKKNAAKKGARERWQVEKDLLTAREQLRTHAKLTWAANKPLPKKIAADFDALVERRKVLEEELKAL